MLTYYIVVPIIYLLSYIPTGILYRFAHVIAFILNKIVGYRHKVVITNVRNSFPEKSEKEIQAIAKESYLHLAYRIVESIRCYSISKEEIENRISIKNIEVFDDCYKQGRHIVQMVGHIGPWEFDTYKLSLICKHKLYAIVSKVSNPHFNNLIQRTRGRLGMHLIFMQDSKKFFETPLPEPSLVTFICDQSPSNPDRAHWSNFLHRDTAFFTGAERYAKLHNSVVIFTKVTMNKEEGHYIGEFIKITDTPNETAPGEITEKFVRLLEQQIQETPADWLWSHKRWKHKRNSN